MRGSPARRLLLETLHFGRPDSVVFPRSSIASEATVSITISANISPGSRRIEEIARNDCAFTAAIAATALSGYRDLRAGVRELA
jgi:hypothetical protein